MVDACLGRPTPYALLRSDQNVHLQAPRVSKSRLFGPAKPAEEASALRESENNQGEMRLEEFLYRTDTFRSNTFHGHDNSEMKTEFLTAEENLSRHLRPEIDAILSQHRIPTESFHHTLKARVTGSYFFLLRVTVTGDGSTFIRLGPTKDSLVKLLRKNSLTNDENLK
ncbi:hypothetical protein N7466_009394 [Penicillium verhagenii]|uniref:uncharacterized protein n=1 Tax=Penicillium verhagenii TaxID=1562060 RepID=UPI00254566D1|nr:uncharacterized protein N7466_009394 [Penicillium verhagenii]KAJ5921068.1 hypothetical protein N7466_009394 [Penicillium verhagenii]